MAWVIWGACAGHPAAPNASNQELSDKGRICSSSLPPSASTGGLKSPPRVQQGHLLLWAKLHHAHLSPGLELRVTNCPLRNTHLCNSNLCLHQQEEVENQIKSKMMQ